MSDYITDYGEHVRVEATDPTLTNRPQRHNVYQLKTVEGGKHPTHKDETTEEAVWVLIGSHADQQDAHSEAKHLAGVLEPKQTTH